MGPHHPRRGAALRRVLLIGCGPLPGPEVRRLGFPQLRLAHFRDALIGAGHAVRTVALVEPEETGRTLLEPWSWEGVYPVAEEGPGWLDAVSRLAAGADLIVSAGPYNPGLAATVAAGREPVWADVPGDPFAELQAVAIAAGGREPAEGEAPLDERVAAAQAAAWAVLGRADAFSAISAPQRHALIGQLGLVGRLADAGGRGMLGGEERVFVVPVAWDFALPERAPRPRAPGDPLGVALVGGFNTWFDIDTLVAGLERALARDQNIFVVATGGGIPRHHGAAADTFAAWASRSRWRDRVNVHGWVPHHRLPELLTGCHVGICLDRPGYEAELGSRTRLLFFANQGLLSVGTARAALAQELVEEGMMVPVPPRDPAALASALVSLAERGVDADRLTGGQGVLARRYAPSEALLPLLSWVEAPSRLPPARAPAAALAEENARLKAELTDIYASPTWRTLSRLRGPLRRRPRG